MIRAKMGDMVREFQMDIDMQNPIYSVLERETCDIRIVSGWHYIGTELVEASVGQENSKYRLFANIECQHWIQFWETMGW